MPRAALDHGRFEDGLLRSAPLAAAAALPFVLVSMSAPVSAAPRIVDYQSHLSPRFVKRPRRDTRFIVVHSTECHLSSALRTLSQGKVRRGRYITRGGHANYLVARNGTLYRILDPRYRADHAGVSMWNGVENLSDHSIGIELEGYHDRPFTSAQYETLRWLLRVLRQRFGVASRDVLEHCRVAYTRPNRFYSRSWRGRKLDPGIDNFDRRRAGLDDEYAFDPDVVAGRLGGERRVARVTHPAAAVPASVQVDAEDPADDTPGGSIRAEVILPGRTAWSIAGAAHHAASTLYVFPDGSARTGDQIPEWNDLPVGTEIYLDLPPAPTGVLSKEHTAWRIAGGDYDSPTTLYYLPEGRVERGDEVADWSNLPAGTRIYLDVPDQPET